MIKSHALVLVVIAVLARVSLAQSPEIVFGPPVGLTANGVGSGPCGPQNCLLFQLDMNTLSPGTLTVSVFGEANQPFFLVAALSANSCTLIPGITDSLMLDPPFFILAQGIMPATFGISICGNGSTPGRLDLVLNIPPGFCVPGFQLFVQALVFDLGLPVFTCTIRAFC